MEHQPLSGLFGKDADHCGYGHDELMRHPAKTPATGDVFISQVQVLDRIHTDVENDLAILDKGQWNLCVVIHLYCQVWRISGIGTPFKNGADQIRFGGGFALCHEIYYLRMAFSAGVIASMYPGRENRRSAYFISGVASLSRWMP